MNVHIALYKWKKMVDEEQVVKVLKEIESLVNKVPGIVEISTGLNTSKYSGGYTHVILVRGRDQEAIDSYRNHPDHIKAASIIDGLEDLGIGVDFATKS